MYCDYSSLIYIRYSPIINYKILMYQKLNNILFIENKLFSHTVISSNSFSSFHTSQPCLPLPQVYPSTSVSSSEKESLQEMTDKQEKQNSIREGTDSHTELEKESEIYWIPLLGIPEKDQTNNCEIYAEDLVQSLVCQVIAPSVFVTPNEPCLGDKVECRYDILLCFSIECYF